MISHRGTLVGVHPTIPWHSSSLSFCFGRFTSHSYKSTPWMGAVPGRIYTHLHMAGFHQDAMRYFCRASYRHPKKNLASLTRLASNIYTYIYIYVYIYVCVSIYNLYPGRWRPNFHHWKCVFLPSQKWRIFLVSLMPSDRGPCLPFWKTS